MRPRLVLALIAATLVGFGLGAIGYMRSPGWDGQGLGWEDAAFRSLQLLFLNYDTSVDPPSLALQIARWTLAGVAVTLLGIIVFFVVATEQARRRWASMRLSGHVIVIAQGDWLAQVVASLRDGDDSRTATPLAILTPDEAMGRVLASNYDRITSWPGSPEEAGALSNLRLDRAAHVIIAMGDDPASIRAAGGVREHVHGNGRHSPLAVVVLIASVRIARELIVEGFEADADTSIEFVSPIEIGTSLLMRRLVREDELLGADPTGRIIVAGDSEMAGEVVLRGAIEARARGQHLEVELVGAEAGMCADSMNHSHPGLRELATIKTRDRAGLLQLVATRDGVPVLMCADSETDALARAIEVLQVGGTAQRVYLLLSGPSSQPDLSGTSTGVLTRLNVHALRAHSLTPDVLLNTRREEMARRLHERYLERRRQEPGSDESVASHTAWDELTDDYRLSNRAAADRLLTGVRRLGYVVVPDPLVDPLGPLPVISGERLELGARIEHDMWCDQKTRDGWKLGHRDEDARTHPMLVPYDELPEDERQKDRDIIADTPSLFAQVGLRILEGPSEVREMDSVELARRWRGSRSGG